MKKEYIEPSMKVIKLETTNIICTSPDENNIKMNSDPLEGEYD